MACLACFSSVGRYMIMPTQEYSSSGCSRIAAGLMGAELAADQRCSMGAGAGVSSASSFCMSSCMNSKSSPDGLLRTELDTSLRLEATGEPSGKSLLHARTLIDIPPSLQSTNVVRSRLGILSLEVQTKANILKACALSSASKDDVCAVGMADSQVEKLQGQQGSLLGPSGEGHFQDPLLPTAVEAQNFVVPANPIPLAPLPELCLCLRIQCIAW